MIAAAASDGTPSNLVLISVDSTHKPGSTTELRNSDSTEEVTTTSPFQAFVFEEDGKLVQDSFVLATAEGNDVAEGAVGGLRNLLYSLENLRKRDGEEKGGGNGADVTMGEEEAAQLEE